MSHNQNKEGEIKELEKKLEHLKKQQENKNNINPYLMPIAIIIAGFLVAGAVLYSQNNNPNPQVASAIQTQQPLSGGSSGNVIPVSSEDHIKGDPNALVKIIEFSDFECPFCKVFHTIMGEIMNNYGKRGKVAWIYRHLPVDNIHTKARKEAVASECANEIGGNTAFWKYAGRIFEITPSNDNLDLSLLSEIAEYSGVAGVAFDECLESGRYDEHIENDFRDAINSGANGTPYTIILSQNGTTFPLNGAQTYATLASFIELALKEGNN